MLMIILIVFVSLQCGQSLFFSFPFGQPSICLAGDSAAYRRTAAFDDDVVIVA